MTTILPIARLDPDSVDTSTTSVKGVVTLVWPYSSSKKAFSILLVEPDFRLRRDRGQIRITFKKSCAKALARAEIASGNELELKLAGCKWASEDASAVRTPGRTVGCELIFDHQLHLQVTRDGETQTIEVEKTADSPELEPLLTPQAPQTPLQQSFAGSPLSMVNSPSSWSSPAFPQKRTFDTALTPKPFDLFADEAILESDRPIKRRKFGLGSHQWRFVAKSPSPSISSEDEQNDLPRDEQDVSTSLEQASEAERVMAAWTVEQNTQPAHSARVDVEPSPEFQPEVRPLELGTHSLQQPHPLTHPSISNPTLPGAVANEANFAFAQQVNHQQNEAGADSGQADLTQDLDQQYLQTESFGSLYGASDFDQYDSTQQPANDASYAPNIELAEAQNTVHDYQDMPEVPEIDDAWLNSSATQATYASEFGTNQFGQNSQTPISSWDHTGAETQDRLGGGNASTSNEIKGLEIVPVQSSEDLAATAGNVTGAERGSEATFSAQQAQSEPQNATLIDQGAPGLHKTSNWRPPTLQYADELGHAKGEDNSQSAKDKVEDEEAQALPEESADTEKNPEWEKQLDALFEEEEADEDGIGDEDGVEDDEGEAAGDNQLPDEDEVERVELDDKDEDAEGEFEGEDPEGFSEHETVIIDDNDDDDDDDEDADAEGEDGDEDEEVEVMVDGGDQKIFTNASQEQIRSNTTSAPGAPTRGQSVVIDLLSSDDEDDGNGPHPPIQSQNQGCTDNAKPDEPASPPEMTQGRPPSTQAAHFGPSSTPEQTIADVVDVVSALATDDALIVREEVQITTTTDQGASPANDTVLPNTDKTKHIDLAPSNQQASADASKAPPQAPEGQADAMEWEVASDTAKTVSLDEEQTQFVQRVTEPQRYQESLKEMEEISVVPEGELRDQVLPVKAAKVSRRPVADSKVVQSVSQASGLREATSPAEITKADGTTAREPLRHVSEAVQDMTRSLLSPQGTVHGEPVVATSFGRTSKAEQPKHDIPEESIEAAETTQTKTKPTPTAPPGRVLRRSPRLSQSPNGTNTAEHPATARSESPKSRGRPSTRAKRSSPDEDARVTGQLKPLPLSRSERSLTAGEDEQVAADPILSEASPVKAGARRSRKSAKATDPSYSPKQDEHQAVDSDHESIVSTKGQVKRKRATPKTPDPAAEDDSTSTIIKASEDSPSRSGKPRSRKSAKAIDPSYSPKHDEEQTIDSDQESATSTRRPKKREKAVRSTPELTPDSKLSPEIAEVDKPTEVPSLLASASGADDSSKKKSTRRSARNRDPTYNPNHEEAIASESDQEQNVKSRSPSRRATSARELSEPIAEPKTSSAKAKRGKQAEAKASTIPNVDGTEDVVSKRITRRSGRFVQAEDPSANSKHDDSQHMDVDQEVAPSARPMTKRTGTAKAKSSSPAPVLESDQPKGVASKPRRHKKEKSVDQVSQQLIQETQQALEEEAEEAITPFTKGVRTKHAYISPLSNLSQHLRKVIDGSLALVVGASKAERAPDGPRDWHMSLYVTDGSMQAASQALRTVQIFRPSKSALPLSAAANDVILLHNFRCQSLKRKPILVSTDASGWALFSEDGQIRSSGPPIEFDDEEQGLSQRLHRWWATVPDKKKMELRTDFMQARDAAKEALRRKSGRRSIAKPGSLAHELRDGTKYPYTDTPLLSDDVEQ